MKLDVETPVEHDVKLTEMIVESKKYNYEGLRIPLKTSWNTDLLADMLQDYPDEEVLRFLKYGWPIDRDETMRVPDASGRNHKGATQYPEAVDKHILEEIELGAVVGGFDEKPLNSYGFATLPLNTRPKCLSTGRRIILDLSWGQNNPSINEGLNKNRYLGKPVRLRYPTVFTLVERIKS